MTLGRVLSTLSFICALFLVHKAHAHGRLTKPRTRDQVVGLPTAISTSAVPNTADFVCRNLPPSSVRTAIGAGDRLTVRWDFTVPHPGECYFYLSYDTPETAAVDMQWFKIAQIANCDAFQGKDQVLEIPEWVPAGNAVLRWEWVALQGNVAADFYCQCADLIISNPGLSAIGVPLVRIPGHLPGDRAAYRDVITPGAPFYFTGPELAHPSTSDGADATPAPTRAPTTRRPTPAPTTAAVTPAPTVPAPVPTPEPTRRPTRSPTPRPTTPDATPAPSQAATTPAPTRAAATPAPTRNPTRSPTAAAATGGCSNTPWGQCSGLTYNGPTCCPDNFVCKYQNPWYSQCLPVQKNAVSTGMLSEENSAASTNNSKSKLIMIVLGSGFTAGLFVAGIAFGVVYFRSKSRKVESKDIELKLISN